jgi:hypothetical protein
VGTGPLPGGTITFATAGDSMPSTYSLTDGISVWAPPDLEPVPLEAFWPTCGCASDPPILHGSIQDDVAPETTGATLAFTDFRWTSGLNGGSYSLALVPEPTIALLLACGLVGLGVRRRLH